MVVLLTLNAEIVQSVEKLQKKCIIKFADDEMPAAVGVEAAERCDGTEAVREVAEVAMRDRHRARAEVDGEACPNALREVEEAAQSRLPLDELAIRVGVVLMDVGLPVIQRPFAAR